MPYTDELDVDEAWQLDPLGGFEQPLGRRDVVLDVGAEAVGPAESYAGLAGEMEHRVRSVQHAGQIELAEITLEYLQVGVCDVEEVPALGSRVVVVGEQVDHHHLVTVGEHLLGQG